MDWTVWTMFALTEGTLSATPGVAVMFVVSQGLRSRSTDPLWAAAGILAANALYFAASGTGVGTLLFASSPLFTGIKWAGAAYLLYLGAVTLLRTPPKTGAPGPAAMSASDAGPFSSGASSCSSRIPRRCFSSWPSCPNSSIGAGRSSFRSSSSESPRSCWSSVCSPLTPPPHAEPGGSRCSHASRR